MSPLLKALENGHERQVRELYTELSQVFRLSDEERNALQPSGTQPLFNNRVRWARFFLNKAGLLETPRRGWYRITQRGRDALNQANGEVNNAFLMRFPEFRDFISQSRGRNDVEVRRVEEALTSLGERPRER
jgi:restriction system protein